MEMACMNESDKQRKVITVQLDSFYMGGNNPKSLDDILDILHSYRYKYKLKHDVLWLEPYSREDEWGHEVYQGVQLKGKRLETYTERDDRVNKQLLHEARLWEKQQQEYERLKSVFEGGETNEGDTQSPSG